MITHDKLEQLRVMKIELADLKAREMSLRLEVAEELSEGRDIGTSKHSIEGFVVKVVTAMSYTFDQTEITMLLDRGLLPQDQIDLIRTKYELRLGDYKKAYDTEVIDDAIIVKPAAPTVTIELGEE